LCGIRQWLEALERRTLPSGASVAHVPMDAPVPSVSIQRNIVYTHDGGQAIKLDLYRPRGSAPPGGWPAVVAFPGGGWRWASRTQYGASVGQLAHAGFVVAVADYTYSSGKPGSRAWPNNFIDARNAVRWVRSHAEALHIDSSAIAAEGVSSGSYLASLLATYPDGPITADAPPTDPASARTANGVSAQVEAVVDFYGPVDLAALYGEAPRDDPYLMTFLGGTPAEVPGRYAAASVNTYVGPGDPPFFIVQGTSDQTVVPGQSNLLAADLKHAGVAYSLEYLVGLGHGFEFAINERLNLLPQVVTFLHQAFGHQPITTATT
jgi:acetyl esterase/lipase